MCGQCTHGALPSTVKNEELFIAFQLGLYFTETREIYVLQPPGYLTSLKKSGVNSACSF
jgi:hypothetical protein